MKKAGHNCTYPKGGVSCFECPALTGSAEKVGTEMVQDEVAYLFFLS